MPYLSKVTIVFVTHNDNKDHDTVLNVQIKNKKSIFLSELIADGYNLGGDMEFVDPSTHSFDLALKSTTFSVDDINVPVVNIHIQPNGNDRWVFDCTVFLTFDDGKQYASTTNGIILDQDNKDYSGVFSS